MQEVTAPSSDVDYIVQTDSGYLYYKYINNQWEMIAGSSAEIISPEYTIDYKEYGTPQSNDYSAEDYSGKYYLNLTDFKVYLSNGANWSLVETLAVASELTDYYLDDGSGTYVHYRYINNRYEAIGVSSTEMETLIANTVTPITNRLTTAEGNISTMQTTLNNLSNMVKDVTISDNTLTITYNDDSTTTLDVETGIDIDSVKYNQEDSSLRFYDGNNSEIEKLKCVIPSGGGGSVNTGTAYITRVTSGSVNVVHGTSCNIDYKLTALDASNELTQSGVGTLYVNNVVMKTGFNVSNGLPESNDFNTIDVGEYLNVGSNIVKISVSVNIGGETNIVVTKTWSVNAINMYLEWNYTDSQINTSSVVDYYTPYGALSKTIYTFIDVDPIGFNPIIVDELPSSSDEDFDTTGNYFVQSGTSYTHYIWDSTNNEFISGTGTMLDVTTTTRSGVQQALTIPMQTHGSHTIVRYMVGDVNNIKMETIPQAHDMVFVTSSGTTPIIATSFNTATMTQYNTVQIPIVVYDPSNTTPTVYLYEDGNLVSTWTNVDRTLHYWNYSPTTYGTKTLTITCGETTKTLKIVVEQLSISESEVPGYDFRFKASEIATNSAAQSWSATTVAGQPVTVTYSNNFDWVNGGLHTEQDESGNIRQYFAVRAGTTMTINYDLFGQNYDPKQFGKNFKFIFKAVNCRTYDAQVLSCMDNSNGNNGVGLVMTANNAVMTTLGQTIETHYCKDAYIEFEANIHPYKNRQIINHGIDINENYLQFWIDGCIENNILYAKNDDMQQVQPVGITIGSPNCDVYVYMIKAYPVYMTNNNELSNFIMDAPNAFEMVNRYNRNDILENNEINYQKLAEANPDLHIILLDLDRMSTGKDDEVLAYTFQHIYNAGGASQCFTVDNAGVKIQGTSSVGYLESAGNLDINFKYNRTITYKPATAATNDIAQEYTTSEIKFQDNTKSTTGYSINKNSIPVDYLNVKVNVASSENCNNACIADWYNTYQPWISPVKKKNPKTRDTMEFVPAVIFIRDRNPDLTNANLTQRNVFGDTQNFHFYGICDIGNSKKNKKVFHDTTNPLATCVEVSNNTSLPCLMASTDYAWNQKNEANPLDSNGETIKDESTGKPIKVFEFRYEGDMVDNAKSAWDRFVKFMYDHNPNLATNNSLGTSVTFAPYTFKGSGTYDTSVYDSDNYDVIYLYGYGLPTVFNNGMYAASDYVTDTTANATCYYYINYSNNQIYSSNGTTWTSIGTLTWTRDNNSVLGGTTISTYAGTYTTDSFNYRMAYLLEHCEEYMVIDPVIYHFIFIESFLMTDNVAKNTFWSSDDLVHWELSKDYDNDTSLGNDNVGGLSFTYGLETDDIVGNSYVFNAHDAAWITFARGLFDACAIMYRNRESAGCFNTSNFLAKAKAWQDTRPERVWVADAQRKYLRPYEDNETETYLPMLAGKKTHQREQVKTYNAYYYASKYVSDFCTAQNIMVRGNTPTTWQGIAPSNTATLSMYINCYIVVASTSYNVVAKVRANRGTQYTMDFSTIGSMGETELYFCTAPMITELSGLAHLYFKQNNFSMATNLQRLEIGSNVSGYSNPNLETLTIGTNKMLEYLDVRNCPNVSGSLDLSGCVSLKELYLENTAFTGVSFANGGLLEIAHLPSLTMLALRRLIYLDDITITSLNNLVQLIAENCDFDNSAILTIGNTSTSQSTKDIILNIIESSSNLSRVRLIGLDWSLSSTTVLNSLLNMTGIGDNGYSTSQSVLTGDVYLTTAARNSELSKFNTAWSDLHFTYPSLVVEYLIIFKNPDETELYRMYYDFGSELLDPVTNNLISTPIMESNEEYNYTFLNWKDSSDNVIDFTSQNTVTENMVITANYTKTKRTYTVAWYAQGDNNGNPVISSKLDEVEVEYGSEVSYEYQKVESPTSSNLANYYEFTGGQYISSASSTFSSTKTYYTKRDLPTDTSGEINGYYRLFKGWDKSTGYIRGNINVIAQWETRSGLPSRSTDLKDMSCVDIYAVCQAKKADKEFDETNGYWLPKDYFEITLGHDLDFSNVTSKTLVDLDHPVFFNGSDGTNTGTRIVYNNGVGTTYQDSFIDFDGSNSTTNPEIKLFSTDAPSFTLAIEYEYLSTNTNGVMLSAGSEDDVDGFKLNYSSSNPCIRWGNNNQAIGASDIRNVMVLRHVKGSDILYAYTYNSHSDRYTDIGNSSYPLRYMLQRTNTSGTEPVLSLGAVRYKNGVTHDYFAKGWVYWCKLWEDDLGDTNAKFLAAWIHEKIRMEYTGRGTSGLRRYAVANTNSQVTTYAEASFLANNSLSLLHNMNNSDTNVGGWATSNMRSFLNARVYNALPVQWRSAIKSVNVKSSIGGGSSGNKVTTTSTSVDKLYLVAYTELIGANSDYNGETYNNNIINYFVSNSSTYYYKKVKFIGLIVKNQGEDGTQYFGVNENLSIDPTDSSLGYTVNEGDVWFRYDGANKIGYMYISEDTLAKHTRIGYRAVSSTDNIVASASGLWVRASYWWERSPYVTHSATFLGVYSYGYPYYIYGASNANGVAVGFSV